MRSLILSLLILLTVLSGVAEAQRRMTRVAPPTRPTSRQESAPRVDLESTPRVSVPGVKRPAVARPQLLEPALLQGGAGQGAVASFELDAPDAVRWELLIREVGGPIVQMMDGEGPPPVRLDWDGRTLDGALAWCGLPYEFEFGSIDSTGDVTRLSGDEFRLDPYLREEARGVSWLLAGADLTPARRHDHARPGDPVAAAEAGLARVLSRLERDDSRAPVRIEVLAANEREALALAEAIQTVLVGHPAACDRAVEAFVGVAATAPGAGTVLITTVDPDARSS